MAKKIKIICDYCGKPMNDARRNQLVNGKGFLEASFPEADVSLYIELKTAVTVCSLSRDVCASCLNDAIKVKQ